MYGTWCKAQFISEKLMVKMENNGRQHKLGHYVQARPQIAETLLEVFDVDRAADHGDLWILLHCCHHNIPRVVPWGIVPTCMVSAWWPSRRVTPSSGHMLTFSIGASGCPGIFPFSPASKDAAICASCVSIILLKLNWFLRVDDKVSTLIFKFSRVLSLAKNF